MSFQAYLDNIQVKTGKGPDDFRKLAQQKGFTQNGQLKPAVKAGEIVTWLKEEFGLCHGHAMAIYTVFKKEKDKPKTLYNKHETFFKGTKARWSPVFY